MAIGFAAGVMFHPQVSSADGFDGASLMEWSEASQVAYLQNSIVMTMTVSSRLNEVHASCISDWFFEGDRFRDGRLEELRTTISRYADYHPGGVIVAMIERECGEFGRP